MNQELEKTLFENAKCGKVDEVKRKISEGADVNWVNESRNCYTALMIACREGACDVVEYLLSVDGIQVNLKDAYDFTAFELACQYSKQQVVQLMLRDPFVQISLSQTEEWSADITKRILCSERECYLEVSSSPVSSAATMLGFFDSVIKDLTKEYTSNDEVVNLFKSDPIACIKKWRSELALEGITDEERLVFYAGDGKKEEFESLLIKSGNIQARDYLGRNLLCIAGYRKQQEILNIIHSQTALISFQLSSQLRDLRSEINKIRKEKQEQASYLLETISSLTSKTSSKEKKPFSTVPLLLANDMIEGKLSEKGIEQVNEILTGRTTLSRGSFLFIIEKSLRSSGVSDYALEFVVKIIAIDSEISGWISSRNDACKLVGEFALHVLQFIEQRNAYYVLYLFRVVYHVLGEHTVVEQVEKKNKLLLNALILEETSLDFYPTSSTIQLLRPVHQI